MGTLGLSKLSKDQGLRVERLPCVGRENHSS